MEKIEKTLHALEASGNLRRIPLEASANVIDLSSNDYLGLAVNKELRRKFLEGLNEDNFLPSSSASRLLAGQQREYAELEQLLTEVYGKPALLFNSGYHANTGIVAALGGSDTLFVADKLVHASIIDGLKLSGSVFRRFRHNDLRHLETILEKEHGNYSRIVIIVESVYSMDGDSPDLEGVAGLRLSYPNALLMVDEAHAVGVSGPQGKGLTAGLKGVDIMIGTFGKALGSMGAFAIMDRRLREFMVNTCRSLIFSTALPPVTVAWSRYTFSRSLEMDEDRKNLRTIAGILAPALGIEEKDGSHIMPMIVGDARKAVLLSQELLREGIKVLPIRTPTVPPGTERLRFSLSADICVETMTKVAAKVAQVCRKQQFS